MQSSGTIPALSGPNLDELQQLVVDISFVNNVYGGEVRGRNLTDRGRTATSVTMRRAITNRIGTRHPKRIALWGGGGPK